LRKQPKFLSIFGKHGEHFSAYLAKTTSIGTSNEHFQRFWQKQRTFSENRFLKASSAKKLKNISIVGEYAEKISTLLVKMMKNFPHCRPQHKKNTSVFSYNAEQTKFYHTLAIGGPRPKRFRYLITILDDGR